jgi:hypothetical protein
VAERVWNGLADGNGDVTLRTGAERDNQIHICDELDAIPLPGRAGFAKVFVLTSAEAGAHEDVENVVHVALLQAETLHCVCQVLVTRRAHFTSAYKL